MALLSLVQPYVCGGGGLWDRPLVSPLSPPPLPPLLLPIIPLTLALWVCRACCMRGAGAWPLGVPPPCGEITIIAIMAQSCSSGTTPLPNGGCAPSPLHRPVHLSLLAPSIPLNLTVGGLWCLGVPPPLPSCRPCVRSARCCLEGTFTSPSWSGGPPPSNSFRRCTRSARCCLRGALPSLYWLWIPPHFPLLLSVHRDHVLLLGGCPPLLHPLAAHRGSLLPGQGVPLYPLAAHGKRMLLCGGFYPPSSTIPWLQSGGAR